MIRVTWSEPPEADDVAVYETSIGWMDASVTRTTDDEPESVEMDLDYPRGVMFREAGRPGEYVAIRRF